VNFFISPSIHPRLPAPPYPIAFASRKESREQGKGAKMPIVETLEPSKPEELQHKIFATKKEEDYMIIQAVSEHVCFPSPFITFPPSRLAFHLRPPSLLLR
jgi:hypothetical protein